MQTAPVETGAVLFFHGIKTHSSEMAIRFYVEHLLPAAEWGVFVVL